MRNVTGGEEPASGNSRPQRDRRKQKNNLQAQIRKSYVDSDFPPGGGKFSYLPRDCIESLVTREAVAAELGLQDLAHQKQYKGLIKWILSSAPRLFLIVLNSQFVRGQEELHDSMALFRSSGFDDSELPWSESCKFPEDDGGDLDDTWTRSDMIEHFPPAQWKFLALVIRSEIFTYNVQPKVILPFTQVSSEKPKEGAFGKVYRVKIHQSHTDYSFDEIAVKEIQTDEGVSQASTVEAAWQAEVGVLKLIKGIPNPHLIECLAAIERGRDRYLLFPWADGGSLRDYWENTPHQTPTHSLVKEALVQLQGLGAALSGLHYLGLNDNSEDAPDDLPHVHTEDVAEEYNSNSAETSIRHGDLKPENLLWFTERSRGVEGARYLKIADMGLAKRHVVRTQDRSRLTTTTYGTILYEAPEAEPAFGDQPRSRLYDIWSMGCIITEWIIWLLYGNKQLQRFYNDLKGPNHDPKKPVSYYILSNTSLGRQSQEPILHPQVVHWISHIRSKHPECQRKSAINDLLKLVEEKLLVFRLPDRRLTTMSRAKSRGDPLPAPSIDDSTIRYRATSIDFEKAMSNILHEVEISHDYLLMSSVTELSTASHPPSRGSRLHPQTAALTPSAAQPPAGLGVPQLALPTRTARNNYTLPPLEDWKFPVDNDFAADLAALLGQKSLAPTLSKRAKLCEACSRLKIWEAGFDVAYQRDKLQQNSTLCDLCSLLWHAWSNASEEVKASAVINFDRIGSTIHIRGAASQAALSLFRSPGQCAREFDVDFTNVP
ncbi:Cyclin-dependent kinase 2 [Colletotrichum siamense]|uniref:Cyclin-dependent kinase 2 n=1 Tax=Colletotrichum siamense TaxID=690259 RepID=A0A9P5EPB9_COLSI|nr:Cyclin-dependent kinase 2 [Colletotrichum siamense]KAF4856373.1 Cyclin-dependent kinase 2 [Colletotrichum siamense]